MSQAPIYRGELYMMSGARDRPLNRTQSTQAQISRHAVRLSHFLRNTWDHLRHLEPAARIEKEEHAMGNWPRRLLHVPTMTSHEWKPGNWYGSKQAPLYNAISYTWGRWLLRDGEMPEVDSLVIKGVPWKIPRVHPSRFTKEQFMAVIRRATTDRRHPSRLGKAIDYVWLDIACIDQRILNPGSTGAAEVGRQAKIFRGAAQVSIWLNTLTKDQLHTIQAALTEVSRNLGNASCDSKIRESLPVETNNALQALLYDPWFSSLW